MKAPMLLPAMTAGQTIRLDKVQVIPGHIDLGQLGGCPEAHDNTTDLIKLKN
jgi:hypothetical protein